MQEKYKADYHVHTLFSDDSDCPMEVMIQRGIELHLNEICFTDHVDYGVKTDLNCAYKPYFLDAKYFKEKYKDKIAIKTGIEFGVQEEYLEQYHMDALKHPFDFIILSIHEIGNKELWTYDYQKGKTQEEYNRGYYESLLKVIENYKDYSILGHLDLIKRYDQLGVYSDDKMMPYIIPILKQVIKDNKGIEVNTSSFHYGLLDLMPSRAILKKYFELGGKIITIGSDAHEAKYLFDHADEVKEELKKIGFKEFATFDKMKPIFHEL